MAIVIEDRATVEQIEKLAAQLHVTPSEVVESLVREKAATEAGPVAAKPSKEEVERAVRGIQERIAARPVLDARSPDEILGYNANGYFD